MGLQCGWRSPPLTWPGAIASVMPFIAARLSCRLQAGCLERGKVNRHWTGEAPWVHLLEEDARRSSFLLPPSGTSYVAWLDGAEMGDEQRLFEQMNARLRFPVYFGWNWNALSDCLRDMGWAPADHYLIVIEQSALMLRECAEERETLLEILERAGQHWGHSLDRPGKSFNSLLL